MMPQVTITLPPDLLVQLKKEAARAELSVSALVRHILTERAWRKTRTKDKQHWLEGIYAGKSRRKMKTFEDFFS